MLKKVELSGETMETIGKVVQQEFAKREALVRPKVVAFSVTQIVIAVGGIGVVVALGYIVVQLNKNNQNTLTTGETGDTKDTGAFSRFNR